MTIFKGKGVYGAVAIGKISVFKRRDTTVKRIHVSDTAAEKKRLEAAKEVATAQLQEIYDKALKEVGEQNAQIFEIHMMMLLTLTIISTILSLIQTTITHLNRNNFSKKLIPLMICGHQGDFLLPICNSSVIGTSILRKIWLVTLYSFHKVIQKAFTKRGI